MSAPISRGCVLQPTFLPWLGWFDLVDQVDLLVILDNVAFSKQSWQQRNRIRTVRGLEFITVPVKSAGRLGQPINQVELADLRMVDSVVGKIQQNYRSAPFLSNYVDRLECVLRESAQSGLLVQVNICLIEFLLEVLQITTPTVLASSFEVKGARGERLSAICEVTGIQQYLSPLGAEEYLIDDRHFFDRRMIDVKIQNFEHPQYRQVYDPFISHASVIDLLFNEGPDAIHVIREGRRKPRPLGSTVEHHGS